VLFRLSLRLAILITRTRLACDEGDDVVVTVVKAMARPVT
jgi:hypothetical protein